MIIGAVKERVLKKQEIIENPNLTYDEKCKKVIEEGLVNNERIFSNKGCPLCNYEGYYNKIVYDYDKEGNKVENSERIVSAICECEKKRKQEIEKEKASIPKIYENIKMQDVKNVYSTDENVQRFTKTKKGLEKMLNDIDKYIKNGEGVGIYSKERGSGKTFIITAFANELLEKGYTVRFVNQVELLDRIKASWNREKGEERENDILEDLKKCDCLIIDDLGFNNESDWLNNMIYSLINYRYENKKPLYYTSNHSINEMKFDERIASRLKQMVSETKYAEEDLRDNDLVTGKENIFD